MISKMALRSRVFKALTRFYCEGPGQTQGTVNANVPGLSEACVHPATEPVGPNVDPNKSGAYKVPEYFCYDSMSYFEAEIEMSKYRLPQPSALKK